MGLLGDVDLGVGCRGGITEDPSDDFCPDEHWTEVGFSFGLVHPDGFVPFSILLVFESDVDIISKVEIRVGVWEQTVVFEEADISNSENFSPLAFFLCAGFAIFTGSHAEEEGANCELRYC